MGALSDRANSAFRDFTTDGVPATGPWEPDKTEIRAVFLAFDIALSTLSMALLSVGAVVYPTLSALNADLAHGANTLGFVYNDSTVANNGIYAKSGASGSGSWVLTQIALPSSFSGDLSTVVANVAAITNGTATWTLPDEANGDTIPSSGSKREYLSAGFKKIA